MYLFIGIDAGGADPARHSLLAAHFALVDEDTLDVTAELTLSVRPEDGVYHVTPASLILSASALEDHWAAAQTARDAARRLHRFLADVDDLPVPVAWGVDTAIAFVRQFFPDFDDFVSRPVDLAHIARFLAHSGKLPVVYGLTSAAVGLGLEPPVLSGADTEARISIALYRKFRHLLKGDNR